MDLDLNLRLKCVTLNILKQQEPAINLLHFIKIFWVVFVTTTFYGDAGFTIVRN